MRLWQTVWMRENHAEVVFCGVNLIVSLCGLCSCSWPPCSTLSPAAFMYLHPLSRVKSALAEGVRWQCQTGLALSFLWPIFCRSALRLLHLSAARWLSALAESEENLITQRRSDWRINSYVYSRIISILKCKILLITYNLKLICAVW